METAKAARLDIIAPNVVSTESLGKENQLLQDRIYVMEFELKNAQADNIALQARVKQLQQCNVLIVSNNERISAQVTAGFKEKEALEYLVRLGSCQKPLITKHSITW